MLTIQVFGVFFLIALAGLPLYFSLIATTAGIVYFKDLSYQLDSLFLNLIAGVEPFILIAVPLFIFAGELLARGGVGKRIVNLARAVWLDARRHGDRDHRFLPDVRRRVGVGDCRHGGDWFARRTDHERQGYPAISPRRCFRWPGHWPC